MLALLVIALLVIFCWYVIPIIGVLFVVAVALGGCSLLLAAFAHKLWRNAAGK